MSVVSMAKWREDHNSQTAHERVASELGSAYRVIFGAHKRTGVLRKSRPGKPQIFDVEGRK